MSRSTVMMVVALLMTLLLQPASDALVLQQEAQPTEKNGPQGTARPGAAAPASTVPVPEEEIQDDVSYQIYSILVAREFAADRDMKDFTQWLISEDTIAWPPPGDESKLDTCFRIPEQEKAQYESMIADYKRQNAEPKKLVTKFALPKMYSLLSATGRKSYEAATDAAEKPRRVRKMQTWLEGAPGLISFSAIGYSADHSLALVYAEHECGADCGGGSPHVLKKVNDTWQEQNVVVCRWVPS